MNLKNPNIRYLKMLYAGGTLLAVAAVIAVAVYGTLWKGEAEDGGHASAVELTHETNGGHHDPAVADKHEAEASGMFEITLDAEEWRFEPSVVEVPVGHRVKLTLVNHGMVEHDIEVVGVPTEDTSIGVDLPLLDF